VLCKIQHPRALKQISVSINNHPPALLEAVWFEQSTGRLIEAAVFVEKPNHPTFPRVSGRWTMFFHFIGAPPQPLPQFIFC
jgi:hypothetical protein